MTYLERLRNQRPPEGRTDETDESPWPKREGGLDGTDKTDENLLLSVRQERLSVFETTSAPDPLGLLYLAWLGPPEGRYALACLTPAQARETEATDVVSLETPKACVLVAVRIPSGACGLLAIPQEKYDGWALLELLEAAPWGGPH